MIAKTLMVITLFALIFVAGCNKYTDKPGPRPDIIAYNAENNASELDIIDDVVSNEFASVNE